MSTNFLTFNTPVIRASANTNSEKNRIINQKSVVGSNPSSPPASSNWWSPIFGWSSNPDYIDSTNGSKNDISSSSSGSDSDISRPKYSAGCFTEEKAKQLRMMTTKTETFHDVMYHSAIASRLASDFSRRSDR